MGFFKRNQNLKLFPGGGKASAAGRPHQAGQGVGGSVAAPGRAGAGQKMGLSVHVPLQSTRRDPLPRGDCAAEAMASPGGPQNTILCHGEPSGARLHPDLCFFSPEPDPAAVLEAGPPWLQPAARGWYGPRSCRPVLSWPCSVSWSTWAPCALPADGTCCAPPLCFASSCWEWGWGPFGGVWWLNVETPRVPVLSWDRWDLLLCSS